MGRLIEVQDMQKCPATLAVHSGDVLLLYAVGGHVRAGRDIVEMLGPFLGAVLGEGGGILAPAGSPNRILFRARQPGRATIDVVTGDPFHTPKTTALRIIVET